MPKFLIGSTFDSPKTLTVFETIEQAKAVSKDYVEVEAGTLEEAFATYESIDREIQSIAELFPSSSENSSGDKQVVYREGDTSITYSTKKPEGTFYSDYYIRNGKLMAIFEHQDRVTKRKLADTKHNSVLAVKEIGDYYSITISK
jgi:hypothetical protein